jgi:hypothetical protein
MVFAKSRENRPFQSSRSEEPSEEPMEMIEEEEDSEIRREVQQKPRPRIEPRSAVSQSPPLFIKVDKYKEIIQRIQELRSFALSMRDALDALSDIEKEIRVGLTIAEKALDKFNSNLSILDSYLLRTHGVETEMSGSAKETPEEIEGYVRSMNEQIDKIKGELEAIS